MSYESYRKSKNLQTRDAYDIKRKEPNRSRDYDDRYKDFNNK